MTTNKQRLTFINLPVKDLKASMAFFSKLGFSYNPLFTNDDAACMIVSEQSFVMLLRKPFFETFTTRTVGDAHQQTEVLVAFSCSSREEVDTLTNAALAAGGKEAMPPQDLGFMYNRSFYDLDGHHWEPLWMDPAAAESGPPEG